MTKMWSCTDMDIGITVDETRWPWRFVLCLLVSTYVVCERLSVMHEPARVVENLVQILQNTPILQDSFRIPPPPPPQENSTLSRCWHFVAFQFQNTPPPPPSPPPPPKENSTLSRCWHFVTFQFQNTPPPKENSTLSRCWHFVTFQKIHKAKQYTTGETLNVCVQMKLATEFHLDLGKKVGNLDLGGGILQLRIWT